MYNAQSIEYKPLQYYSIQNELRLIQSSQQGDQNAFALLLQQYQRHVFQFIDFMLNNEDMANQLTEETFVTVWQQIPLFRYHVRFSTWLFSLAYQLSGKELEKRQQKHTVWQEQQVQKNILSLMCEEEKEGENINTIVKTQLASLPFMHRIVLALHSLFNRTYEEIAKILSLPVETVKAYLFQGRQWIKEALDASRLY